MERKTGFEPVTLSVAGRWGEALCLLRVDPKRKDAQLPSGDTVEHVLPPVNSRQLRKAVHIICAHTNE